MMRNMVAMFGYFPKVHVSEIAAAMIDQCSHDITKEPLSNTDLEEMGKKLLKKEDYLQ